MKRILLSALTVFLFAACAPAAPPQAGATVAPPTETPAPAARPLLEVVLPDGKKVGFTLAELQALPSTTITVEGKNEFGPALEVVLREAGVNVYEQVTLQGDTTISLSRDQVTAETILDFTNRGTVKFASTSVPKAQWPHDIILITVK